MPLIIDCSIAVAWFASSQATQLTANAQIAIQQDGGIVPYVFHAEFCNALLMLERRGRLSQADVALAIDGLELIDLEVDMGAAEAVATAILPLARIHRLTIYDAAYLELALRLQLPLATRDAQLGAAAKAAGAQLFQS